jgi:hypothetical protein
LAISSLFFIVRGMHAKVAKLANPRFAESTFTHLDTGRQLWSIKGLRMFYT